MTQEKKDREALFLTILLLCGIGLIVLLSGAFLIWGV